MASTTDTRYILHPVWDPLLRTLHWWLALTIMAQFTSGATLLTLGDDMSDALMEKIDIVHDYGGYAFAAGLALRIVWLFVGPPTACWRDLLPMTSAQRRIWRETLACYLSRFRRPISPYRGHNAFAGPAYLAFFVIAAAQVILGITLSLMSDNEAMTSPLMTVHEWGFFLLLAFVMVHVALVIAHEIAGRHGLVSAMIHGHKGFTESEHQALHADWDAAFSVQADPSGRTEGLDDVTSNNGDDTKPRHE
ncbi:cytochrome b/b6 domain-containing protein [Acidithiobacillus sp.]|uniref:cytochrome b/b6 domain-containing protein n=1 Tax=Acidithiobacillus sp. TaxID=1872118 RepID=UPI002588D996|nr:cytochrome b/b6 domain-containing protein [Acidithiobacillus sp.]MDD5375262.1 cytochrome b/b6 domain-containing protein [Acidithiobacillus sp.]